ncbi:MAG: heat-inducible transcriptional repressor HrcA [Pyrinomonadaceae bacterium]
MTIRTVTNSGHTEQLLDARGQAILSAIIKEHLVTGEPVGSKTVAERFAGSAGWSSATIRNVMGELEEAGLVEQPHTSAGRTPTDKGYRYYVDHLLSDARLSRADIASIERVLNSSRAQTEGTGTSGHLMENVSRLLSTLSENVGIVVSPSFVENGLQHIEFVKLAEDRILVILVFSSNIVQHKVIHIDESFSQDELERTARYLNAEFGGKSLAEIRAAILELMHEETALFDKLLQTAMIICSQSIESEEDNLGDVYVDGTSNMLIKRDFADMERLRQLIRTIEEKSRLVQILTECIARDASLRGNVQVVIGSENTASSLQNCTLITAPYRIGNGEAMGTLSVLGPTRIEYARMISIVSYVAKILEKLVMQENSKI